MGSLDVRRGTATWAFNRFRSDALSKILNDLLALENTGLDENICEKVQEALGIVINEATSIPDGSFLGKPLWKDLEAFKDTYVIWNDVNGTDEAAIRKRRDVLKKLRVKRHKVARRARKNQFVLANDLDLEVVRTMYSAMSNLANSVPDVFKQLAKSVSSFESDMARI
ncbi:MAG: hypothetical protein ABW090_16140 [Sedimenticola sp.]